MNYLTGGAFRRALEQRLSVITLNSGTPLVRLRKMVAFDRFLARMVYAQPDIWVLKGGLALQLRLGGKARTTKDMDLLALTQPEKVIVRLREAAALDLGDWFTFDVAEPTRVAIPDHTGLRYTTQSLLDGRVFEQFHVDIGIGDAIIEPVEFLKTTDLLAFAGLSPTHVPCYPVTQQIAENCMRIQNRAGPAKALGSRILWISCFCLIWKPLQVNDSCVPFKPPFQRRRRTLCQ